MNGTLESLFILNKINCMISKYLFALDEELKDGLSSDSAAFIGLKSMILILSKGFLDEWDKYLLKRSEETDKEGIILLKKKANPAIKRIKEWDGLGVFRNAVLAHNLRKSSKYHEENIFIGTHTASLKIPEDITELILLSELITLSTSIVSEPFKNELKKTRDLFNRNANFGKSISINFEEEYNKVLKSIESNLIQ